MGHAGEMYFNEVVRVLCVQAMTENDEKAVGPESVSHGNGIEYERESTSREESLEKRLEPHCVGDKGYSGDRANPMGALPNAVNRDQVAPLPPGVPWLNVGLWESAAEGAWPDFPEACASLRCYLSATLFSSESCPRVFYVCGEDHFLKCSLRCGLGPGFGVVAIFFFFFFFFLSFFNAKLSCKHKTWKHVPDKWLKYKKKLFIIIM